MTDKSSAWVRQPFYTYFLCPAFHRLCFDKDSTFKARTQSSLSQHVKFLITFTWIHLTDISILHILAKIECENYKKYKFLTNDRSATIHNYIHDRIIKRNGHKLRKPICLLLHFSVAGSASCSIQNRHISTKLVSLVSWLYSKKDWFIPCLPYRSQLNDKPVTVRGSHFSSHIHYSIKAQQNTWPMFQNLSEIHDTTNFGPYPSSIPHWIFQK